MRYLTRVTEEIGNGRLEWAGWNSVLPWVGEGLSSSHYQWRSGDLLNGEVLIARSDPVATAPGSVFVDPQRHRERKGPTEKGPAIAQAIGRNRPSELFWTSPSSTSFSRCASTARSAIA